MATTIAMAVGAAPASAGLPVPVPDPGQVTGIVQGDPAADAGNGYAKGGDGGDADTGNVQVLNGNAVSLGLGGDAEAKGGDTYAKSGDAYGGHGGDAKAIGGDADASNEAYSKHVDRGGWKGDHGHGHKGDPCREDEHEKKGGYGKKGGKKGKPHGPAIEQGHPYADGGKGKAKGGDGGDADTGNKQFGNGNALALTFPLRAPVMNGALKGGPQFGGDDAEAKGGDTYAKSGDAYGGHGGDAWAFGGDATAQNKGVLL
jgi:hypothetical protein